MFDYKKPPVSRSLHYALLYIPQMIPKDLDDSLILTGSIDVMRIVLFSSVYFTEVIQIVFNALWSIVLQDVLISFTPFIATTTYLDNNIEA